MAADFGHPAIVLCGNTSATFPPSSAIAWLFSPLEPWPSSATAILSAPPCEWLCPPPWLWPCSWKRKRPRILDKRPQHPTTRTSFGFETVCGSTSLCIASRKIDRHRATRKTPLTRAPSVSARCHYKPIRIFSIWVKRDLVIPYPIRVRL